MMGADALCETQDGEITTSSEQVTELAALQAVVSRTHARGYQITEESGGGGGGRARRLSQISLAAEIGHVRQAAQAAAAFKLAVEEEPGPVRRPSQSLSLKDKVKLMIREEAVQNAVLNGDENEIKEAKKRLEDFKSGTGMMNVLELVRRAKAQQTASSAPGAVGENQMFAAALKAAQGVCTLRGPKTHTHSRSPPRSKPSLSLFKVGKSTSPSKWGKLQTQIQQQLHNIEETADERATKAELAMAEMRSELQRKEEQYVHVEKELERMRMEKGSAEEHAVNDRAMLMNLMQQVQELKQVPMTKKSKSRRSSKSPSRDPQEMAKQNADEFEAEVYPLAPKPRSRRNSKSSRGSLKLTNQELDDLLDETEGEMCPPPPLTRSRQSSNCDQGSRELTEQELSDVEGSEGEDEIPSLILNHSV